MISQSAEVKDLFSALAKAQGKFPQIPKNKKAKVESRRTGQKFEYSYADLADVIKAVSPVLSEFGLSVTQPTSIDEKGNVNLVTLLTHESGQFLGSAFPLENCASPQDWGSQLTYMRRYALTAVLGVAADEDTDAAGDAGSDLVQNTGASQTAGAPNSGALSPAPTPKPSGPAKVATKGDTAASGASEEKAGTWDGVPPPADLKGRSFRDAARELHEQAKALGWSDADYADLIKATAGISSLGHLSTAHLPAIREALNEQRPPSPATVAGSGDAR